MIIHILKFFTLCNFYEKLPQLYEYLNLQITAPLFLPVEDFGVIPKHSERHVYVTIVHVV